MLQKVSLPWIANSPLVTSLCFLFFSIHVRFLQQIQIQRYYGFRGISLSCCCYQWMLTSGWSSSRECSSPWQPPPLSWWLFFSPSSSTLALRRRWSILSSELFSSSPSLGLFFSSSSLRRTVSGSFSPTCSWLFASPSYSSLFRLTCILSVLCFGFLVDEETLLMLL